MGDALHAAFIHRQDSKPLTYTWLELSSDLLFDDWSNDDEHAEILEIRNARFMQVVRTLEPDPQRLFTKIVEVVQTQLEEMLIEDEDHSHDNCKELASLQIRYHAPLPYDQSPLIHTDGPFVDTMATLTLYQGEGQNPALGGTYLQDARSLAQGPPYERSDFDTADQLVLPIDRHARL